MHYSRMKFEGESAVYHCVTRTVAGERLLDRRGKEVLRKMLWQVAAFSGVDVLAYCVMSNHFHVLIRVPEAGEVSVDELLRRYRILYPEEPGPMMPDSGVLESMLRDTESEEGALWRVRLTRRMHDVSEFMKTLKQRFSIWYNQNHDRFGTLWAERFKSAIVEDAPHALKMVAAYIDLNPVRAGLVVDPSDYRWSSYGEAMGGCFRSQAGLASVLGQSSWSKAASDYRMVLYGKGAVGRVGEQQVIPHERVMEILSKGGKVSEANLLRCRIRYMTEGAILGSETFVRRVGSRLASPAGRGKAGTKALGSLPVSKTNSKFSAWRHLRQRVME